MNALNDLIETFEQNEAVKAFKTLEVKLLNHPYYKTVYKTLTDKQKRMVQAKHYQSKDYSKKKTDYESYLQTLESDPFISEYLHLQSQINEDLQLIIQLIEDAINIHKKA